MSLERGVCGSLTKVKTVRLCGCTFACLWCLWAFFLLYAVLQLISLLVLFCDVHVHCWCCFTGVCSQLYVSRSSVCSVYCGIGDGKFSNSQVHCTIWSASHVACPESLEDVLVTEKPTSRLWMNLMNIWWNMCDWFQIDLKWHPNSSNA